MRKKLSVYALLYCILLYLFKKIEVSVSYADVKNYAEILMSVSSMVFTIMGIWIAFLYPNALQRLVNPETIEHADFSASLSETRRLEGLVGTVLKSAFVVSMILAFFLVKLVISNFQFYDEYLNFLKSVSVSVLLVLTVLQMESLFYVVYSNVMFINELHRKREDREADADI